jgi:hypothetical protein
MLQERGVWGQNISTGEGARGKRPPVAGSVPLVESKQIRQLIYVLHEIIAKSKEIIIPLFQRASQWSLKIAKGRLEHPTGPRLRHVMNGDLRIFSRHSWTPIFSDIDFYEGIHVLLQLLQDLIRSDVSGIDPRLPMIEFDLIAQL